MFSSDLGFILVHSLLIIITSVFGSEYDGYGENTLQNIFKEREDNSVFVILRQPEDYSQGSVDFKLTDLRSAIAQSVTWFCWEYPLDCISADVLMNSSYREVLWWDRYPQQRKVEGDALAIKLYVRYPPSLDGSGDTKALVPRKTLKNILEKYKDFIGEEFGGKLLYILVFDWTQNAMYCGISIASFFALVAVSMLTCLLSSKKYRAKIDEELFKRFGIGGDDEETPGERRSSSVDPNRFMESPLSQTTSLEHEGGCASSEGGNLDKERNDENGHYLQAPKVTERRKRCPEERKLERQKRKREIAMENFLKSLPLSDDSKQKKVTMKNVRDSAHLFEKIMQPASAPRPPLIQDELVRRLLPGEIKTVEEVEVPKFANHTTKSDASQNEPGLASVNCENDERSNNDDLEKKKEKKKAKKKKSGVGKKVEKKVRMGNFSDDAVPFTDEDAHESPTEDGLNIEVDSEHPRETQPLANSPGAENGNSDKQHSIDKNSPENDNQIFHVKALDNSAFGDTICSSRKECLQDISRTNDDEEKLPGLPTPEDGNSSKREKDEEFRRLDTDMKSLNRTDSSPIASTGPVLGSITSLLPIDRVV